MVCEKCWNEAKTIMRNTGKPVYEAYQELLPIRACTPKESSGDYWDEENRVDSREPAKLGAGG